MAAPPGRIPVRGSVTGQGPESGQVMNGGHTDELAAAREALRRAEEDLASSREQVAGFYRELAETSRGLTALHAELDEARQDEARLAAIVQSSDDAMFSLTLDGVIQTWNSGAERLLGYPAAEIIGRSGDVLLPEGFQDSFTATVERLRAGQRAKGYDTRRVRRDGSLVDVAVTLSAIRDADGTLTGFAAVLRDITGRLRAQAELAEARARHEVLADRDRMARNLHDSVIQRLFAAGMALQGAAGLAHHPEVSARISGVVDEIDQCIHEIRQAIFTLGHDQRHDRPDLRAKLLTLVSEATATLGFSPSVSFEGRIADVPGHVAAQVLIVAREALSNAARHAGASAVDIVLAAGSDLVLRVSDNGHGLVPPPRERAGGLRNMRERAELLGGTFRLSGGPGSGTRLEWRVPLGAEAWPGDL